MTVVDYIVKCNKKGYNSVGHTKGGGTMYQVAIYDNDPQRSGQISAVASQIISSKKWNQYNIAVINSIKERNQWPGSILRSHIFFICLKMKDATVFAQELYSKNQFLPIIFYGDDIGEINKLLQSRPIAFWNINSGIGDLNKIVESTLTQPLIMMNLFLVDMRQDQFFIPIGSIVSFESSKAHYVKVKYYVEAIQDCHKRKMLHKIEYRATIEQVQTYLDESIFMRIHKSSIISIKYIERVDKSKHLIYTVDNSILSISDKYYGEVIKKIKFLYG